MRVKVENKEIRNVQINNIHCEKTNLITATEATQVTIAHRTLVSVSMFTMTSSASFLILNLVITRTTSILTGVRLARARLVTIT